MGNWLRVFMTTIAGRYSFQRRKTTYRPGTINFTTSKWIFLDETTSYLEEQEAIRLLRLVREKLPTSGVIMVTHQPGVWNLADDICDISAVL